MLPRTVRCASLLLGLTLAALALGAACVGQGADVRPLPAAHPPLRLCFCAGRGPAGYDRAALEARYGECGRGPCALTLTGADLARYQVGEPPDGRTSLWLTRAASERLRRAAPGGRVADLLGEAPFEISLAGRRLFLGLTYLEIGAAALRHPVMHLTDDGEVIELRIGEVQGRWLLGVAGSPDDRAHADPPELRRWFAAVGRLDVREGRP